MARAGEVGDVEVGLNLRSGSTCKVGVTESCS